MATTKKTKVKKNAKKATRKPTPAKKAKKAPDRKQPPAKKKAGAPRSAEAKAAAPPRGKAPTDDLAALRKPVERAKAALDLIREQAQQAQAGVAEARSAYHAALAPYQAACRKAGVQCEFPGARGGSVTARVSFLVERAGKQGVRVMVQGRPETEEVIPLKTLLESVNKAAYGYTDKHLGPREEIGNKGGGLANRLRALIRDRG